MKIIIEVDVLPDNNIYPDKKKRVWVRVKGSDFPRNSFRIREEVLSEKGKAKQMKTESRTFDTSTVDGIEKAETYKARLENKYDKVVTTPVGLNRVKIEGRN